MRIRSDYFRRMSSKMVVRDTKYRPPGYKAHEANGSVLEPESSSSCLNQRVSTGPKRYRAKSFSQLVVCFYFNLWHQVLVPHSSFFFFLQQLFFLLPHPSRCSTTSSKALRATPPSRAHGAAAKAKEQADVGISARRIGKWNSSAPY